MRNALVKTICDEASHNKDIIIVTGDLGYNVLDKFYNVYPAQYINAGISEQNMTSVAAGLGLSGKCVFTYSIGNFSTLRCLEQIRNDICYHSANVKVVALAAGFAYGNLGMSHHATEDIACMRALPNITVFSPCDPLETAAVTKTAISLKTPCYIRLGRGGEKNIHEEFDISTFEIGKAYPLNNCDAEICIFSTGSITAEAVKAVEYYKEKNVNIALYSFPTIKPIDSELILEKAKSCDLIITLEEHDITGGFGGAVAEVIADDGSCRAQLKRFGLQNEYASVVGDTSYLRHYYKLDCDAIIEYITEYLKKEKKK